MAVIVIGILGLSGICYAHGIMVAISALSWGLFGISILSHIRITIK